MIYLISSALLAFQPAAFDMPSPPANNCATGAGSVQLPPTRCPATACVRRRPEKTVIVRQCAQYRTRCDVNHICAIPVRISRDTIVAPGPHAGLVGKSRHKPVPRSRKARPDRRDPASQPRSPKRVTQLSAAELLEQIRQVRIERDDAEAELAMLIDAAVSQGVGWPQIASQLGVTRQAARQQYQRRHPDGVSHRGHVA